MLSIIYYVVNVSRIPMMLSKYMPEQNLGVGVADLTDEQNPYHMPIMFHRLTLALL